VKGRFRRGARRVADDIRERRHLEAYSLFLVTLAVTVVGLIGGLPDRVADPVVLAGIAFLILWTTNARAGEDDSIGDRMHLEIQRSQSLHWFEYWVGRFEAIWSAAHEPA
jgi:hypothetical protein